MVIHNSNSFRTEYHPKPSGSKIDHQSALLTIGSCFSDNIGKRLLDNKFSVLVNPLGTIYNPLSIFKLLQAEEIDHDKFVESGGQHYHLDFHSSFTARDKHTLQTVLELKIKEISTYLEKVNHVIITLGTAYVYQLSNNGEIVSNCHKIPQRNFNKRVLELEEMISSFERLKSHLDSLNPSLRYILTLSPVRHIKDGIAENQLSKSLLRVLCHELSNDDRVEYYPAYELMMDDLRDYRFYKTDMIHPTEMAEDYIWDKFQQTYFSDQTRKIVMQWAKIKAAMAHRPFNPDSHDHQKFLKDQLDKLEVFAEYFNIEQERDLLRGQLQ